jgi:hypothetical protein
MDEQLRFSGMDADEALGSVEPADDGADSVNAVRPRLRRVDRQQVRMMTCSLDDLLPEDHRVRVIWRAVTMLDVSAFEAAILARGSEPGRPATDPRILIAMWRGFANTTTRIAGWPGACR